MFLDLHTHTTASDGQYSPTQLVDMAKGMNLELLAITDHDTMAGLKEAQERADEVGMHFIPGIEISCQDVEEIHILGYGIEPSNPDLLSACNTWSQARRDRGNLIGDYLSALGIDVDLDIVKSYAGDGNLGRPHFAKYLIENGIVDSRKEAFDLYLDTEEFKKSTDRKKPSPADAIKLIHSAGGKAVLAHPGNYKKADITELVQRLAEVGLNGIECFYSKHDESQIQEYLRLAKKYELRVGCGSDFHGEDVKPDVKLGMELDESFRKDLITTLL